MQNALITVIPSPLWGFVDWKHNNYSNYSI